MEQQSQDILLTLYLMLNTIGILHEEVQRIKILIETNK